MRETMAIDGIGKFPISGAPGSVGARENTGSVSKAEFTLQSPSGADSAGAAGKVDHGLLGQVQSGQITRQQYLDIRVDEAVQHLVGQVPAEKLDIIRTSLREQLDTDPLLLALVRRAVGDP